MSEDNGSGRGKEKEKVFLLTENCGRQLVGLCTVDENGQLELGAHGYVVVLEPLELRIGMMQQNPREPAIFGSEFRPLVNLEWTPYISTRYPSHRVAGERVVVGYTTHVRAFQNQFAQLLAEEREEKSPIHCAKEVSKADLAAAAAVERLRTRH